VLIADLTSSSFGGSPPKRFVREGKVRFFRNPIGIDERLPRHLIWHRVARATSRLPPAEPPYPDYIRRSCLDPMIVRRMLARVTATTGPMAHRDCRAVALFEFVLYGVLSITRWCAANSFRFGRSACLSYWNKHR